MIPSKKSLPNKGELPVHGADPHLRPADAFLAEQAAMVDPRRAALARMRLAPEHEAALPEALRAREPEPPAPKRKPAGVKEGEVEQDRPTPEYQVPPHEFDR